MPKIDTITLRCLDPAAQRRFYADLLGMATRADGAVAYGPDQAGLLFEPAEQPYQPTRNDTYWKIALAVPNIEQAHAALTAKGVEVSHPQQFRDIGYLAHFQDPEGFTIELIEHWFQGNRPADQRDTVPFGAGTCLNLLTLRAPEIAPLRDVFLGWGMVPLSVQPVAPHGFTLHFFAFTDERPPNDDLSVLGNREWLYQRPYTVLEIQEIHGAAPMTARPANAAGYAGTWVSGAAAAIGHETLRIQGGQGQHQRQP